MAKPRMVVVMKLTDPGRISSITIDSDNLTRKHIYPLLGKPHPEKTILVVDCLSHDEVPRRSPQIGVRALAKLYVKGGEPEILGHIKYCPLCYRVLWSDFPLPDPNPLPTWEQTVARKEAMRRGRQTQKLAKRKVPVTKNMQRIEEAWDRIQEMKGRFTLYDLMAEMALDRPKTRFLINHFIKENKVEVVRLGGGRGNQTIYRRKKAP